MTDKVGDIFGSVFQRTELSETLTEICKMDPNFEKEQFLKECEQDIIPNILEAIVRGDLEILEDWCYEAPFNVLATPLRTAQQMGYVLSNKVLGNCFLYTDFFILCKTLFQILPELMFYGEMKAFISKCQVF